ncbi:hypothetical protein DFH29DRAFT_983856 [Suillus ampliporus]|nr:hypothetical protein DFH29DRAFT_983856 [Suillus ampliporus]
MTVPQWTIADLIHRESRWWKNRGILILNICLILPLLSSTLNGLDSSIINGLQILPGWQEYFDTPQGMKLGLINSASGIGILSGTPFSPYMSDLLGRRATMFVGAIVILAWCGFGIAFSVNAAPLLISELSYPTHRGKMTSLFNSLWYSGSIISAWICLGAYDEAGMSQWSWRVPTFVQAGIPIIQMMLIWFIPESPRFLMAKGLESQAARVLAHYHANGGEERDPLVVFEMAQIRHALNLERELASGKSYLRCFSTPGNRQRMFTIIWIAIFSQWSGNGLVSYYINIVLDGVGITTTRTKAAINGGLQIFNLASAVLGTMLVDKLGRRKLFLISNIGMLIGQYYYSLRNARPKPCIYADATDDQVQTATVPLFFIFYFFYDLAYTSMLVLYTLEILPYNIRAKGLAIMNFTVYSTNAFNLFINPWALSNMGWKYYLVYCGLLSFELLFVMRYIVETRGRTLEETAALFDGAKIRPGIMERRGEVAMTLARMSPSSYPGHQEGRETVQTFSSASQTHLESQSQESAVAFAT